MSEFCSSAQQLLCGYRQDFPPTKAEFINFVCAILDLNFLNGILSKIKPFACCDWLSKNLEILFAEMKSSLTILISSESYCRKLIY